MPAKQKTQVIKPSPANGTFFCNGEPFQLPKENRATLETRIINHIRILDSVTLTVGRKLLKTALKTNTLKIQIGMEPCCRCGCFEVDVKETADHPLSPKY